MGELTHSRKQPAAKAFSPETNSETVGVKRYVCKKKKEPAQGSFFLDSTKKQFFSCLLQSCEQFQRLIAHRIQS